MRMDIDTNDYDIYNSQGSPQPLPGTPSIDENGHLIIPEDPFFSPSTLENSLMDKDPHNTGPTTDFWSNFPLAIDINGFIFYYNENTGINVRGPEGAPRYVRYDELTEEEKQALKGQDGTNGRDGIDGRDGVDGQDGLDAYHAWLRDNGYTEQDHPIEEFYAYLSTFAETLITEGTGPGSIIANYNGEENTAGGSGAFAMGYATAANGTNSLAAGNHTLAQYDYQTVIGKYNSNNSLNAFEIGSGTNSQRKNAFAVAWDGDIKAGKDITDGYNNILRNKVDKEEGKGLSTNDFGNAYKSFIDNYQLDTVVIQGSNNPISNNGVYTALQQLEQSISGKPDIETGTANNALPLLSYRATQSTDRLDIGIKFLNVTYNPNKNKFNVGDNGSLNGENIIAMGKGLVASSDNQIVLGKYNNNSLNNMLEIGLGTSSNNTLNLFEISKTGDVVAAGDITDGAGNVLSGKQDILHYDSIATHGSTNVMMSGDIYDMLVASGITPGQGINIPAISDLQTLVTQQQAQITALSTQLQNLIRSLYYLTDDTTLDVYKLGVNNGDLYIQNQTDPTPEPEPEEEEEEVEGE